MWLNGGGDLKHPRHIFSKTMDRKEAIAYISAVVTLLSGIACCVLSLYIEPMGVIHASVLMYAGQCLVFAASVFGVKSYIDYQIDKSHHVSRTDSD